MITYEVCRNYEQFRAEVMPLFDSHWKEIALDQEKIKLAPDWNEYDRLAKNNQLHMMAVRDDGLLIGYYVGIIKYHLHYSNNLMAFNDVMYIQPEYRQGMVGVRIFKEIERTLKSRGVEKMFMNTKAHHDFGVILERLGYHEAETVYTKTL